MPNTKQFISGNNLITYDGIIKDWIGDIDGKTVTGNPVVITDAEPMNAESVVATITPIQSGSGTPSPTNVRPIRGLTEANAGTTGKNKVNQNATVNSSYADFKGIIENYLNDGLYGLGYVSGDANPSIGTNNLYATAVIPVISGLNYVITAYNGNNFSRAIFTDEDGNILSKSNAWTTSWSHTASENEKYLLVSTAKAALNLLQVENGSSATAYEPYASNTVTITFGETVYGGNVDFDTGIVTVTYKYVTVTENDSSLINTVTKGIYLVTYADGGKKNNYEVVCNKLPCANTSQSTFLNYEGKIIINCWGKTKEEMFELYGDMEFAYPLETPRTLTLTPAQLTLLKGYNTITTNVSSLTVTYQPNSAVGDVKQWVSEEVGYLTGAIQTQLDGKADENEATPVSVSGNPITITDAANIPCESLSMTIEPIQDLHGYSKPWIGGAGKNKLFIASRETYGTTKTFTESTGTLRVNGTASAAGNNEGTVWEGTLPEGNYIVSGISQSGDSYLQVMKNYTTFGYITEEGRTFTSDGSTVTRICFYASKGAQYDFTYTNLMIRLATETDASFAPYSNECPISGLTSAEVGNGSANKLPTFMAGTVTENGVTITSDGRGNFTVQGTATADVTAIFRAFHPFVFPSASTHTLILYNPVNAGPSVHFGFGYGTETVVWSVMGPNRCISTYWSETNAEYCFVKVLSGTTVNTTISPMVLEGIYSLYSGDFIPYYQATITFGETVYGGYVDFNTGIVTVTKKSVDLGTLNWRSGSYNRWVSDIVSDIENVTATGLMNAKCDRLEIQTAIDLYTDQSLIGIGLDNDKQFIVRLSDMTSTPTGQLVYTLATPTTLTLTPAQLTLLKGYNTVSANGATINLDYQKDNLAGDIKKWVIEHFG